MMKVLPGRARGIRLLAKGSVMSTKSIHCHSIVLIFFSICFAAAPLLAGGPVVAYDPKAGGVRLVKRADLVGETAGPLLVRATGAKAVAEAHGNLTGVLFQATARPSATLASLPIGLSYTERGECDALLRVSLGDRTAVSDSPAWIWAVAAKFAQHEATGAVTLNDQPQTAAEQRFARRWRHDHRDDERLVWARYHPVLEDSLVGFFLVTADAMLGDAQNIRTLPNGLANFEQSSGVSLAIDDAKSRRAASTLDELIRLESQPGDCVMLNDVDEAFVFTIADGKLQISGSPRYHYSRQTQASRFQEVERLNEIFRENQHIYAETNPRVYQTVADFAGLVAFFNYVEARDRSRLAAFVDSLEPVFDRIPNIETPIAVPLAGR